MNFDFFKKNLGYLLILFLVIIIGYQVYNSTDKYDKELLSLNTSDEKSFSQSEKEIQSDLDPDTLLSTQSTELYVHVSGAVVNPGLYKLEPNSRVADAIDMAGGAAENANLDAINLAQKLNDEEKIYLPIIGENLTSSMTINTNANNSSLINKINLNTAGHRELMEIPGVGEKTADKIIEYRSNSPFKSIEDLKRVEGIGNKKFENMKDYVSV